MHELNNLYYYLVSFFQLCPAEIVNIANAGRTNPSGTLEHFLPHTNADFFTAMPPRHHKTNANHLYPAKSEYIQKQHRKNSGARASNKEVFKPFLMLPSNIDPVLAKSDYLKPPLSPGYIDHVSIDPALAKSDYFQPPISPGCMDLPIDPGLAKSDYLKLPASPQRMPIDPRSSLSLRADTIDIDERSKTLKPRKKVRHSQSYSVHTLRRQKRTQAQPPVFDWWPVETIIPPPDSFDF